jgi:hypothetical protein
MPSLSVFGVSAREAAGGGGGGVKSAWLPVVVCGCL